MTCNDITQSALEAVRDDATLFAFLRDCLGWLTDPEDIFTYAGPEVGGIAADVRQLVPFSGTDPFVIMLVEFHSTFKRGDLRAILQAIRTDMRKRARYDGKSLEEVVFVCASDNYASIRFAHFRTQEGRQPRLSVFGWERDQLFETRTLCTINLPALILDFNSGKNSAWDQATIKNWRDAWDVEKVTKQFFGDYRIVFEDVEKQLKSKIVESTIRRDFTQRLFNRLMFVHFLSKKGWLTFEGDRRFLRKMFITSQQDGIDRFYQHRLYWLFFHGLGHSEYADEELHNTPRLVEIRGNVPFLNGGLFNMEDDLDIQGEVSIPDAAFSSILDLFEKYNFTITESTPLDVEVAVDPEMLGKVFEELVTGRHESGSYYTPRPIVTFMCREAIKEYLGGGDAIASFVDDYDASKLTNPEEVLEALKNVRVCDPACGSGAYLLGMMQELLALRKSLFTSKKIDAVQDYQRKLEIIQHALYGVDLDPFAVNTARLRLWLSLVVDSDIPVPLPNLDFKIEIGDSLLAPNPQEMPDLFRNYLVTKADELAKMKGEFMRDSSVKKPGLKRRILDLEGKLTASLPDTHMPDGAFDWRVRYAEVFSSPAPPVATIDGRFAYVNDIDAQQTFVDPASTPVTEGGFDIVLANPPYVRQELIKDLKPALKQVYGDLFCGTADLYVFFYYRALQLLRPGGMLVFISSNKWLRAGYGARLRAHLAATTGVRHIIDFGDLPVFQSATTYPMIIVAQNGAPLPATTPANFTQVKSLADPYPDVRILVDANSIALPADALHGDTWRLVDDSTATFLRQLAVGSTLLRDYVDKKICRGLVTGCNDAFFIDTATRDTLIAADAHSAEIIKPLAVGKDIRKWHIRNCDPKQMDDNCKWLIFATRGININDYPAVKNHLSNWRTKLEPRPLIWDNNEKWPGRAPGDYPWYELQASPGDIVRFERPKIVYPDFCLESRFAFDTSGTFLVNTAYIIPSSDLYLLGVLNSQVVLDYYIELSSQVRGGYLRFFREKVELIPIPNAPAADRAAIAALVQQCLDARGTACTAWEEEINERVARLYGV